ncbi:MAG: SPOR domain-containing protein [Bacteroidales bacterium]|nr:SPOR domain-containing protein [Bacteroidales bacterium]
MSRYLIILFLLFLIECSVFSQTKQGKIEVISDPRLDQLIEKHIKLNETIDGIAGYRIQIFSESGANSRSKAENLKNEFTKKYPDIPVYIVFSEPNYKVRVGNIRNQYEALGYLKQIQLNYPGAFIVSDKIKLPELE